MILDLVLLLIPLAVLFVLRNITNEMTVYIAVLLYKLSFALVAVQISYSWLINVGLLDPIFTIEDSLTIGGSIINTFFSTFLIFFYVAVNTYLKINED